MVEPELSVGKYQRAVFPCRINTFFGIVDGMRQRVDVIPLPLDVRNVLYISFQNDVTVFFFTPQVALLAHIVYLSFQQNAVFDVLLYQFTAVCLHPCVHGRQIFAQNGLVIILKVDAPLFFRTYYSVVSPIIECLFAR